MALVLKTSGRKPSQVRILYSPQEKAVDRLSETQPMDIGNPYYKKTIDFTFGDYNLKFNVSQDLFSSQVIDHGTQRLLRTLLFEKIDSFSKALDLGCGYGPIGVVLKKICPNAEVQMVDRDALALVYAQENAKLNGVDDNVSVYGSLGYDNVTDTDFDLIVSNIPAKVGEHVLTHMLKDARFHLKKEGMVIIVVIDAIADYIKQELTTDESIEITYYRSWPGHHVYHYRFKSVPQISTPTPGLAFERGEYSRQENQFSFGDREFTLKTTFHLPEFDRLSYDSSLLLSCIKYIKNKVQDALVFSPGQGYIPVAIADAFTPQQLLLVDRDLQALKVSKENLTATGYDESKVALSHQIGIDVGALNLSLVMGILPEQQSLDVYRLYLTQAYDQLVVGGTVVLGASSTVITRIEDLLKKSTQFEILRRKKDKGRSALVLRKLSE